MIAALLPDVSERVGASVIQDRLDTLLIDETSALALTDAAHLHKNRVTSL